MSKLFAYMIAKPIRPSATEFIVGQYDRAKQSWIHQNGGKAYTSGCERKTRIIYTDPGARTDSIEYYTVCD